MCFNGEKNLGRFVTLEEAAAVRKAAEEKLIIPFLEQYNTDKLLTKD